jgi:hypothetical protein
MIKRRGIFPSIGIWASIMLKYYTAYRHPGCSTLPAGGSSPFLTFLSTHPYLSTHSPNAFFSVVVMIEKCLIDIKKIK